MPVKVPGGVIETVLIEQAGPIAFVESTTLTEVFEEDANRCLLLSTDERPTQTRRVLNKLAGQFAGVASGADAERVRLVHQAAQRMIPRAEVIVPYAARVAELYDASRVEARRSYGHLITLTSAVTLLHFAQRRRDLAGRLVADWLDYAVAAALAEGPIARTMGGLPPDVRRFWQRLSDHPRAKSCGLSWTIRDVTDRETISEATARRYLNRLVSAGVVVQESPQRGRVAATWHLVRRADQGEPVTASSAVPVPVPELVFGWSAEQAEYVRRMMAALLGREGGEGGA
jgi:hypothetical protein